MGICSRNYSLTRNSPVEYNTWTQNCKTVLRHNSKNSFLYFSLYKTVLGYFLLWVCKDSDEIDWKKLYTLWFCRKACDVFENSCLKFKWQFVKLSNRIIGRTQKFTIVPFKSKIGSSQEVQTLQTAHSAETMLKATFELCC